MSGDAPKPPPGMFPQEPPDTQELAERRRREANEAKEKRASRPDPKRPEGSPPHALEPTISDPDAVPDNIRQREEIRAEEDREFLRRHGSPSDVQFQQPGAPSQQHDRVDLESNYISERTREEMDAGRRKIEAKANREGSEEFDREEQERLEAEQLVGAAGPQGEQKEERRKEEEARRKIWGDPPENVHRDTIAGARDK